MREELDLTPTSGELVKPEYFEHPEEGWLSYDPVTLYISGVKHSNPISLPGKFWGTKQPHVRSCSEPGPGNAGCVKFAGCRIGQKYPGVGPGPVIMELRGTVSTAPCYDYFETTRAGKPVSQLHYGMEGWKLNTSRTTIDVLGRTGAIESGKLNEESSRQAVMASKPRVWQMEIAGLLPPWWPLMKKKGIPLPDSAKHYPQLAEEPSKAKRRGKSK